MYVCSGYYAHVQSEFNCVSLSVCESVIIVFETVALVKAGHVPGQSTMFIPLMSRDLVPSAREHEREANGQG